MKRLLLLSALLLTVTGAAVLTRTPDGPRSIREFDPDRTADLEVDMWQAYYRKENVRLFRGLITLLHDQNRYSWARATEAGFYLARAAATFGKATGDYERVLPDLEKGYAIERNWLNATFDPASVARAELAWWVARRVAGQNSPDNVGRLIAQENALLYGVPADRVFDASLLRARAGRLRDDAGDRADWAGVSRLLHASYRSLYAAVH